MKRKLLIILTSILMLLPATVRGATYTVDNSLFEGINAEGVLIAETTTGEVIYEQGADKKIYPASTTKLLTAMLVLDNCSLTDVVTVNNSAISAVPWDYVKAGIYAGETFTVEELLNVMLIMSANDVANVLAEHVAGTVQNFVVMMNDRAAQLGCQNSHFTNPSGIHNSEHYSTAREISIIARAAYQYPDILRITSKDSCSLPKTSLSKERTYKSTNQLVRKDSSNYYQYCVGGKTGYTNIANECLVAFSNYENTSFMIVIMGEKSSSSSAKFAYSKKVFEYLHSALKNVQLCKKGEVAETIKIKGGTRKTRQIDVLYGDNLSMLVNIGDEKLDSVIEYDPKLKAPITAGQEIGSITYTKNGETINVPLIAGSDVAKSYLLVIVLLTIVFLILLFCAAMLIARALYRKKRRKSDAKNGRKSQK